MRQLHSLVMAGLVFGVAACGSKSSSDNTAPAQPAPAGQAQTLSAADKAKLDSEFAQIPQAAIVRVPVDAQGNTSGLPEMHTYSGSEGLASGQSAAAAFDAGTAPRKLVGSQSELDGNTSTQSWTSWSNYSSGYYNTQQTYQPVTTYLPTTTYQPVTTYQPSYGYGNNSYQQYYSGWNSSYWTTTYKPTLYWQGMGWNYGNYQPYNYTVGNYNYYCYRPYKYW